MGIVLGRAAGAGDLLGLAQPAPHRRGARRLHLRLPVRDFLYRLSLYDVAPTPPDSDVLAPRLGSLPAPRPPSRQSQTPCEPLSAAVRPERPHLAAKQVARFRPPVDH